MDNNKINRRKFLKDLLPQSILWWKEIHGEMHFNPYMLDELPDETLEPLKPVLALDSQWEINGSRLLKVSEQDGSSTEVYKFNDREIFLIGFFNSGLSLKTIAERFAAHQSMEYEKSFKEIREMFLKFCKIGLCHPAQDLEV